MNNLFVSGHPLMVVDQSRLGASSVLMADGLKETHDLGRKPELSDLDEIIKSAWHCHGS